MKKNFIYLVIVSFIILGCNKEDSGDTDTPYAQVSFYAAIPDAPELSFLLNGDDVAVNVPYGSYTLYYPVSNENVSVQAQSSSQNINLDTTFSVVKNGSYSVFFTGTVNSVKPYILRDSFPSPDSGFCGLRFFVFATGVSNINLHIVKDTTVNETGWANRSYGDNIANDSINRFSKFALGTYTFYAIDKTNIKDTLAKLGSKTFSDLSDYTIMLEGYTNTSDTSLFLGSRLH